MPSQDRLGSFCIGLLGWAYARSVISGRAVVQGQGSADEVVLDVDDDEAAHRMEDLDPEQSGSVELKIILKNWLQMPQMRYA